MLGVSRVTTATAAMLTAPVTCHTMETDTDTVAVAVQDADTFKELLIVELKARHEQQMTTITVMTAGKEGWPPTLAKSGCSWCWRR